MLQQQVRRLKENREELYKEVGERYSPMSWLAKRTQTQSLNLEVGRLEVSVQVLLV